MATSPMTEILQHVRRAVLLRDGAGLTDGQLLECFISRREEAALAALVRRHSPMVWGVCRRVLGNHHDAEDAFQATFLVLVRRAASILPRDMVANWLYGVAYQTALKTRGTVAKRTRRERQMAVMPEAVEQDPWKDLHHLLDQELSRLPDKHRAVIVLCDLEEKTRKEAARQLGVPEGTVASRLARARTMLAKRLARQGAVLSGGALAALLSQQVASASVPTSVVSSTVKMASLVAAGQTTAGLISANVAALTEGVLKTLFLTKLKVATAVLLAMGVVGAGAGTFCLPYLQAEQKEARQDGSSLQQKGKGDRELLKKTLEDDLRMHRRQGRSLLEGALVRDNPKIPDRLFREAVSAIDAGDVKALERLLAAHPKLVRERIDYGEGYFRQPYLLWFVAENPVRNDKLPRNIAQVTRTILQAAERARVDSLREQLDYALQLVCSGRVARECGVQRELIDVLMDAGADPDGALVPALAHHELAAAERLLERGAKLTLVAAVCTGRADDVTRLARVASANDRQIALAAAALYGKGQALTLLIDLGVDLNAYSPDGFHSHATALHHAVDSGCLDAVKVLVEAGAELGTRDRLYQGTPLGWAEYLERTEIATYLREKGVQE